jgi:hypothetical protein
MYKDIGRVKIVKFREIPRKVLNVSGFIIFSFVEIVKKLLLILDITKHIYYNYTYSIYIYNKFIY